MSDQASQLLSQELPVLKNINTSLQRLTSIENLLERVATAVEATRASQERVEQMTKNMWEMYKQARSDGADSDNPQFQRL